MAQSLRARDGVLVHFGAALWEKYNLTALAHSRSLPRLFVSHQRLLAQPLETVRLLYEQLLTLGNVVDHCALQEDVAGPEPVTGGDIHCGFGT